MTETFASCIAIPLAETTCPRNSTLRWQSEHCFPFLAIRTQGLAVFELHDPGLKSSVRNLSYRGKLRGKRPSRTQSHVPVSLVLIDYFCKYTVHCTMKPFHLIGRRFIWRSSQLLNLAQMANFRHNSFVHFLALVTQYGKKHPEAGEDLFNQHLRYRFCFLVFQGKCFGLLSPAVHTR